MVDFFKRIFGFENLRTSEQVNSICYHLGSKKKRRNSRSLYRSITWRRQILRVWECKQNNHIYRNRLLCVML